MPDRPVVLRAWDYHTMWCNSVALERAGITADTPDPVLGEIPHRDDGSVLGTLREWGAVDLVTAVMPPARRSGALGALGTAADYYLARGVTWVQDAWVEPGDVDTYIAAARSDVLRMRFNLALYADPRHFDSQVEQFRRARRRVDDVGSPLLTAQTVKFFADGVIENETGALLAPYCRGCTTTGSSELGGRCARPRRPAVSTSWACRSTSMRSAMRPCVRRWTRIEYVVGHNGPRDRRPVIAHAQLVDDADIDRFAELGVIPNMQPLWAQLDALMTVLTVPRLGAERADKQYRIRTIDESGAPLAFGSDWPVSSGAPLDGIAVAVSRQTTDGSPRAAGPPTRSCPSSARCRHTPRELPIRHSPRKAGAGSMPGASAICVWLNRDPRTTAALDLPALRVLGTYLRGRPVYSATD